jgi:hypothetical protein
MVRDANRWWACGGASYVRWISGDPDPPPGWGDEPWGPDQNVALRSRRSDKISPFRRYLNTHPR